MPLAALVLFGCSEKGEGPPTAPPKKAPDEAAVSGQKPAAETSTKVAETVGAAAEAAKAAVEGKTVTFAPLPSLVPKATATYQVVVRGMKAGDVRFGVELTSDQMTSPATETESTHIYAEQD
jgi:hypothetical protein